jgi:hypothetical protein
MSAAAAGEGVSCAVDDLRRDAILQAMTAAECKDRSAV